MLLQKQDMSCRMNWNNRARVVCPAKNLHSKLVNLFRESSAFQTEKQAACEAESSLYEDA